MTRSIILLTAAMLLYDDDVLVKVDEGFEGEPVMGKRAHFKEVIGVGLTYKFLK